MRLKDLNPLHSVLVTCVFDHSCLMEVASLWIWHLFFHDCWVQSKCKLYTDKIQLQRNSQTWLGFQSTKNNKITKKERICKLKRRETGMQVNSVARIVFFKRVLFFFFRAGSGVYHNAWKYVGCHDDYSNRCKCLWSFLFACFNPF